MDFIIIVGAGAGISYGVAKKFGGEGFKIGLIARTEEKLKQQVVELKSQGIEAIYSVGDASSENSLKNALFQLRDKAGHASMVLYNAVAISNKDVLEEDWVTIKSNLDVSVGGYFNLMKIVLPFCIQNNKGKLFVTGGGFALSGDPQWTSLGIGKAALRNLVQAFQKRVTGSHIHIAHLIVSGYVSPEDEKYSPKAIAQQYWKLYNQKSGEFENEIIY